MLDAICSRRPRKDVPLDALRDRVLFETAYVCGARASEVEVDAGRLVIPLSSVTYTELTENPRDQLRSLGEGRGQRFEVTCHGLDGSAGYQPLAG